MIKLFQEAGEDYDTSLIIMLSYKADLDRVTLPFA